jgi:hypothetical protein
LKLTFDQEIPFTAIFRNCQAGIFISGRSVEPIT